MSLPELRSSSSLDRLWEDLAFSEAQLSEDADAVTFTPRITALIDRCEAAQVLQKKLKRQEIRTSAKIAALNQRLDATTSKFHLVLLGASGKDRKSALYRRYMPDSVSAIVRLGLASQIETCKHWPTLLATESDPALQAYAATFEAIFAEAKPALQEREKAQLDRQLHRAREIEPLFEDANATRRSIFGALTEYAGDHHLSKDWARSFFPVG